MKLVLLPGMDGTGELFAPFVSALPNSVTPIVVSFPRTKNYGYDDLVEVTRRYLPDDEPFALLGESYSGPIATILAAENSEHLRALIYSCSFVRNPVKSLSPLRKVVPLVPTGGVLPDAVRNLLLGVDSPEIKGIVGESLATVSPDVIRSRLAQVLEIDVTESLKRVSVPMLYLRASNDRLVSSRSGDHILKTKPKTQVTEVRGPHLLLQTKPTECANVICGFLDEVRSAVSQ